MKTDFTKYEKIITINDFRFDVIIRSMNVLMYFIQEKCSKDNEQLEYFQCNLTDSEKNPFAKDLKIV